MLTIHCGACGKSNKFDQPYPYHAGFGNQGFLYNEAGNATLVWSSFDPEYVELVGNKHPWVLDPAEQHVVEAALLPSPLDGRWLFSNPPRCQHCREPIGKPITSDIYYLLYPGSVLSELADGGRGLKAWLCKNRESG